MSVNLAILVGITQGQLGDFDPLPGCENDLEAMRELLDATGKYEVIEPLLNVSAHDLLAKLRLLQMQYQDVNELTFYYTGHGTLDQGDFYLVLNGFEPKRADIKGLSKSDLFKELRPFNASVSFVMFDACHSGVSLFKSSDRFFEPAVPFNKLHIITACAANGTAKGGQELSAFTNGFIEALGEIEGPVIYFNDIERAMRSIFKEHDYQQPQFINQSDSHDTFCDDKAKLQHVIDKYTGVIGPASAQTQPLEQAAPIKPEPNQTELEILQAYDRQLASFEVAQQTITAFSDAFVATLKSAYDHPEFFSYTSDSHSQYGAVEEEEHIVDLVSRRPRRDSFVIAKSERREKKSRDFLGFSSIYSMFTPKEYETIYTLLNKTKLEKVHLQLKATPTLKPLKQGCAEIVFIPTLDYCLIFYRESLHALSDWDEFAEDSGLGNWQNVNLSWGADTDQPQKWAAGFALLLQTHLSAIVNSVKR